MRQPPFQIVGREEELAAIAAFVKAGTGAPSAMVLEGDAGIGKTTLWRTGVELARGAGMRVLVSRPAEAERSMAHAGLGDLLDGVLDEALPALSLPRQRALRVALLRDDPSGDPVDPRALGVAFRDTLLLLAGPAPVIIAIDDAQWLDSASSSALAFALRRIGPSRVSMLVAQRSLASAPPSALENALGERLSRLPVGALSVGAMHQLLHDQLGSRFARQTLLRIHAASGGNPFYATELARSLGSDVDPLQPLPVPATLEGLLRKPIVRLGGPTRDAMALVAALGSTSDAFLERAGIPRNALEPALASRVIEREGGTVRFAHPLLASILYQDLGARRRGLHARVAELVDDPVARARHLALSRAAPSGEIAARLDVAVQLASDRGASAIAAEFAEHAGRLTPPSRGADRRRRALVAARAHQAAGEWTRARAIALDLLAATDGGPDRAFTLILLAELEGGERAGQLLDEALDEAGSGPALQSLIHCRLAWAKRFAGGFDHADAALALADTVDDEVLRTRARAVQATLSWFAGTAPAPDDLLTVAQQLPDALGGDRLVQEGTLAVVNTFAPAPRIGEAREAYEREHAEWRDRDEPRSARALWGLAWLEFWAGRWTLAAEHAAQAHDIAVQYGLEVPQDHLPIAVIAVHRGQLQAAREHSELALAMAEEQFGFHPPQHMAVLGLVTQWEGDRAAALEWFLRAEERATSLNWGEPSLRWWTPDHAELLLEMGRVDDATRLVAAWDADALRVDRPWVQAHAVRCLGLIAAAGGNIDQALAHLGRAVDLHEAVGDPFGKARALLALGAARRRDRQKRAAREATDAAVEAFSELEAARWAAKATAESRRISGRAKQQGLTPAERGIAALVAEGKTNREIASALYLGERTVASHLTHIYAKLGLRSRTELANRLRDPAEDPTAAAQDSEVLAFPARRSRA